MRFAIKHSSLAGAAAILLVCAWAASSGAQEAADVVPAMSMEEDTDRPGANFRNFRLDEPRPEVCRTACAADVRCRAYTYVKPGFEGPKARCWLKHGVPPTEEDDCCISGVRVPPQATGGDS